ncbi:hypothetical protein VSDG_04199 [Cytospora chrysosperma]|uniref:Killer toxin Kp4 domain-containing protein n=1 Tax=Cytospora chrysosperma TaxID=252740 RepID=A0A423W110_CYTCH|nr:hypothetical protein VSDG_04199 [Valsa sordida]
MKAALFPISLLAALCGHASARACTDGLMYCGYNLLKSPLQRIGKYYNEIVAELNNKYITVDDDHIKNSLFACGEGGHGWIIWHDYCSTGCRDGGSGHSDHC